MRTTILIAGAGQLGSRYLQGLANCKNTLDIYVQDISEHSLQIAKQRWEQVVPTVAPNTVSGVNSRALQHKVTFVPSLEKTPKQIDIAIVATNADVRPQVVAQIVESNVVRYWILEKVLAQSESALDEISTLTQKSSGTWVNIPRRMMAWQQQIRDQLRNETPLHITGSGSLWGLACNGIHYLDLVSWWTGEKLIKIDSAKLDSQWIESKRKGFYDLTGKISAVYSEGTTLSLESLPEGPVFKMLVEGKKNNWTIDESNGLALGPGEAMIKGCNEMQSSMTSKLVDDLLAEKRCDLPKLSESVETHRVFLRTLLEHWNEVNGTNINTLPIT